MGQGVGPGIGLNPDDLPPTTGNAIGTRPLSRHVNALDVRDLGDDTPGSWHWDLTSDRLGVRRHSFALTFATYHQPNARIYLRARTGATTQKANAKRD